MNPNFKKLHYVRYVDNFIVGVVGSRQDIVDIQYKIKFFLKSNLNLLLNVKKTSITNFSKDFVYFLGTYIKNE